jgi:integrase/recombinase XerD
VVEDNMRAVIDAFIDHTRVESSEHTVAAYQNDLSQFLDFLQHDRPVGVPTRWDEVTPGDVTAYVLDLKEREYAPASVARKVAALKSFFAYVLARGLISYNPASEISSPRVEKHLPHTIEREKVERLLAEPAQQHNPKALRDRALLELLYATGMRVSEVVGLDLADVDIGAGIITCDGRKRRARTIKIAGPSIDALDAYLMDGRSHLLSPGKPHEPALFVNHRGQRLTRQGLWLIVKYYADQVGITDEVTPHTLRHSFAAHKLASGEANVQEVQRTLGHASRSTTQVYTMLAPAEAWAPGSAD